MTDDALLKHLATLDAMKAHGADWSISRRWHQMPDEVGKAQLKRLELDDKIEVRTITTHLWGPGSASTSSHFEARLMVWPAERNCHTHNSPFLRAYPLQRWDRENKTFVKTTPDEQVVVCRKRSRERWSYREPSKCFFPLMENGGKVVQ